MFGLRAAIMCPYCANPAERMTGHELYGSRGGTYRERPGLDGRIFFACKPCDAHVGTHKATGQPLGSLANGPLRKLRSSVHSLLDRFWLRHTDRRAERLRVYSHLAKLMDIDPDLCHVALFRERSCLLATDIIMRGSLQRSLDNEATWAPKNPNDKYQKPAPWKPQIAGEAEHNQREPDDAP